MSAVFVFTALAGLMAYVLFGYPVLLGWMAKRSGRPVQARPMEPSISFLISVYNGQQYLDAKLRSILALDYPRDCMEILVASDGSTDDTAKIAALYREQGVRLMELPRGGKPAALNAMAPQAKGEILVLTDVRQELAPDSVKHLVACFADPRVGVVSGELRIRSGKNNDEAAIGLYWRFETWIRDRLSTLDSMFGATGPFYAIRRNLVIPIPVEVLLDDMYLPLHAFFAGYRLVMEPRAKAFDFPTSLDTEFRRKVRTLAGNYQLLRFYPQLLGPQNRMWLHFMSYKIGRLLLPWALLGIFFSSLFLPDPWRVPLVAGQVGFYTIALLDWVVSEQSSLKRITSPARTFLTMMVAAVAGLSVFFVPPQRLWKVTGATKA